MTSTSPNQHRQDGPKTAPAVLILCPCRFLTMPPEIWKTDRNAPPRFFIAEGIPRHQPPKKNAASSPTAGKEEGKSSGSPSRVRARLFRARLNTIEKTTTNNNPQQHPTGQHEEKNSRAERPPPAGSPAHHQRAETREKEQRRGEGRGVARRPMFQAERLTAGDHQRQQVGQLHAQNTRQTADALAGNSPGQVREVRNGHTMPRMCKMQEKFHVKMLSVLLIAT